MKLTIIGKVTKVYENRKEKGLSTTVTLEKYYFDSNTGQVTNTNVYPIQFWNKEQLELFKDKNVEIICYLNSVEKTLENQRIVHDLYLNGHSIKEYKK